MGEFAYSEQTRQRAFTLEEVLQLEQEEKLLRVLQPDVLERIKQCLAISRQKVEPFIVECNGAIYFSFLNIADLEQRCRAIRKVQQWQTGIDVDLSSLPRPLHQLLQPHRAFSQRLMRGLVLGGIVGTIAGVLAMAVTILVVSAAELILGTTLGSFGEMQITAVAFVIFAVLGWMIASFYFWNRFNR